MTAKDFLSAIKHNKQRIKALHERKQECYWQSVSSTAWDKNGKTDGINQSSKVEDAVCRLDDEIARIEEEISSLNSQTRKAENILKKMTDLRHKDVLTYRYLNDWPWSRVAEHMGINKRWALELHRAALEAFDQIMNRR